MNKAPINIDELPSKGLAYPEDISIQVEPVSIRQQMDMDRYGISYEEYYKILLEGIHVEGFKKYDLLLYDVQYIDLIRRFFSFDTKSKIIAKDCYCPMVAYKECDYKTDYEFYANQVSFTEYGEDVFKDIEIDEGKTIKGKEYTFDDGLSVVVAPLTIKEFIDMMRKTTSKKDIKQSEILLSFYSYAIKYVYNREYKDDKHRREFITNYVGDLYKSKDRDILINIEKELNCSVRPFITECPKCGATMEVIVTPSTTFHQ